jgi:hypothetical protein
MLNGCDDAGQGGRGGGVGAGAGAGAVEVDELDCIVRVEARVAGGGGVGLEFCAPPRSGTKQTPDVPMTVVVESSSAGS